MKTGVSGRRLVDEAGLSSYNTALSDDETEGLVRAATHRPGQSLSHFFVE
jgi:hypothetical protein